MIKVTSAYSTKFLERFWARVVRSGEPDGCWEWHGPLSAGGYGKIRLEGTRKFSSTHRLAYIIQVGPIPKRKLVLHQCDNRRCLRESHLFVGTQKDNIRDMFAKGRANKARGRQHGMAKLTEAQVLQILKKYRTGSFTLQELGDIYGVCVMQVSRIVRGKRWAHLQR
jgi:hypothetical protein